LVALTSTRSAPATVSVSPRQIDSGTAIRSGEAAPAN
jgi:hypothetical protein